MTNNSNNPIPSVTGISPRSNVANATSPGDRNLPINQVYPPDAFYHNGKGGRVLDVTKPPFNAKGDGQTDDTKALCDAMRFVANNYEPCGAAKIGEALMYNSLIIYLPDGEYLVSDTVQQGWPELAIDHGANKKGYFTLASPEEAAIRKADVALDLNGLNHYIRLVGQSRAKTVIRLKDACPGFGSVSGKAKPVVSFCLTLASLYSQGNDFENITIETGKGNPGAAALRWAGANWGGIRNTRLRSGDGQGRVGLLMDLGCAEGYLRDLDIDGFETGIDMVPGWWSMVVIEHSTLRNQSCVGLRVGKLEHSDCLAARKLRFQNVPLAAKVDTGGHLVLLECVAEAAPDAGEALAAANDGHLYVRAFESVGFRSSVLKEGAAPLPTGTLAEYASYVADDTGANTTGAQPLSLALPVCDMPIILPEPDLAKWADVQAYGATGDGITDDTDAIQRAMDSGKPVVFFSRATYVINGSVAIPASVREVNFLHGAVYRSDEKPTTAMFHVAEPSAEPLLIHQNLNAGGILVDHEADRPLVLEDLITWFNHVRGCAGEPGMMFPGKAAQGKDVWQLYRNTRPGGAPKVVYGANMMGFAGGDQEGRAAVENVRAWLRQCDNENQPGPQYAFRRSQVWMLGFKTEGTQQLFQVEDGSRVEVLGGTFVVGEWEASFKPTKPMFRASDSEVSAHFHSLRRSTFEYWPQVLEGTRDGQAVSVPFRFAPFHSSVKLWSKDEMSSDLFRHGNEAINYYCSDVIVSFCAPATLYQPRVSSVIDLIDGILTPAGLRCEFLQAPLGIDETKPRLSWRLESSDPAARGLRQTAYQLLVASSRQALDHDQGDLWDSGRISGQANRCAYAGKPLTSRLACHWKVRAWDQDGKVSAWSAPALWTMGLLRPDDWSATWILEDDAPPEQELIAPLFRKTFDLSAAPVRATVYVSSLGYHELHLNGQKVGRDVLAPQVTVMDQYVYYVTHDVSALVKKGTNCLGLWLGDGFVSRFFPTSRPQGIVQLEIECRDGRRVTVVSDETWKTHPSHITRIGAFHFLDYGGERFDGGRELPDWNQPTLNDADWQPVCVRTTGTPTRREAVEMDVPDRLAVRTPLGTPVLRAQPIPSNVILQELSPKEIKAEANQTYTVDLGQMVTGWFAIAGQGTRGQEVTLHYLQALEDAGKLDANDQVVDGRRAMSKDVILPDSEGGVRSCNKFNYHTFRYVRVEGLAKAPEAGKIKAQRIGPALTPAFSFTCSNDLANRIHQASMNTLLANSIGGYISDCPERERAAYAMYCLFYAPFLMQHFAEGAVFLEKTIRDAVDAQRQDGLSATCSPVGPGGPAGKWTHQAGGGYVFAQAPWQVYLYTGDTRALAASRAAAEKYLARVASYFDQQAGLVGIGQWDYLADWYAVIEGEGFNPLGKVIQANSMYIVSLDRLSKSLEVLGEREAAARYGALADEQRHRFHAHYYKKAQANYGLDHMTYLAEPLLAQVPPTEETDAVFRALEHNIRVVAKGHPTSGDGGTQNLMQCLTMRHRPDLVYLMVNQTDQPSWGAMVKNGDASFWEHWFQGRSRCHVMVGSIGEWFLNGLAGIQCDPARPGFRHAVVRPYFPPDMDSLSASSDSVRGRIAVSWRKRDGAVTLEVSIPPNTTATLVLPVGKPEGIAESGKPLDQAPGIRETVARNGSTFIELFSGHFVFGWRL